MTSPNQQTFVIVSQQEAKQDPYPYVFVEDDGSVHELRPSEKTFLETPFLPMDGGRPAIKDSYQSKNGWGSVRGFCSRSNIPEDIDILKVDQPASLPDLPEDDHKNHSDQARH